MGSIDSGLVIVVPEADAAFGDVRRAHDPSARDGLPAHVTVLTPFVHASAWGPEPGRRLRAAVEGIAAFDARLRRAGRFGSTTLFLVPEPEEVFLRLAKRVAAAFPEHPPYGGAFTDVLPHLTLAHGAPPEVLDEVEARVAKGADVRARVSALEVWSRGGDGRWAPGASVALLAR